jgi:ribosomal protein S18 acetylase RimI-like enzyme
MIEVKRLPEDRWREFRDLRFEALTRDPLAFGSSYEEDRALSEEEWKRRMKSGLFALLNDNPVGMIAYVFENKLKTKHVANIYGVYVKKEYRGQGIGKKLVESTILQIKKNKTIVEIKPKVNPEQRTTLHLYEKYGFHSLCVC